ncbi:MAG: hypothetical protein IJ141_03135 [Lachnospiraceae bacterium]|nr:hypothetical protein [Lachnospiraceae bacterium]MBQ9234254.1 hypothetical protein [Lachnospiraceae bacterium]
MFDLLFGLFAVNKLHKEKKEAKHPLSAQHWNNEKLLHEDRMNPNVTEEQILKNAHKGKYYSTNPVYVDNDIRKIVNREAYEKDIEIYGYRFAEMKREAGCYAYKNFV